MYLRFFRVIHFFFSSLGAPYVRTRDSSMGKKYKRNEKAAKKNIMRNADDDDDDTKTHNTFGRLNKKEE